MDEISLLLHERRLPCLQINILDGETAFSYEFRSPLTVSVCRSMIEVI